MSDIQRVDTKKFDDAVSKSGYKVSYIVDTLGISRQSYDRKRKGLNAFRKSEIFVLVNLLNLNDMEKREIFFP